TARPTECSVPAWRWRRAKAGDWCDGRGKSTRYRARRNVRNEAGHPGMVRTRSSCSVQIAAASSASTPQLGPDGGPEFFFDQRLRPRRGAERFFQQIALQIGERVGGDVVAQRLAVSCLAKLPFQPQ